MVLKGGISPDTSLQHLIPVESQIWLCKRPYTFEIYVMITQHSLPMSRGAEHNVFFDPSGQKCQSDAVQNFATRQFMIE
jgi:hypothetical protein